jgi:hypothetical protein
MAWQGAAGKERSVSDKPGGWMLLAMRLPALAKTSRQPASWPVDGAPPHRRLDVSQFGLQHSQQLLAVNQHLHTLHRATAAVEWGLA